MGCVHNSVYCGVVNMKCPPKFPVFETFVRLSLIGVGGTFWRWGLGVGSGSLWGMGLRYRAPQSLLSLLYFLTSQVGAPAPTPSKP